MARRPTLPHPFRSWLYQRQLADIAKRCGVTKTTIRGWRTGRTYPAVARHGTLKRLAAYDSVTLTTDDLLPRTTR